MADGTLGIDIGGSGIKAAVVDTATGRLVSERLRVATPSPSTPDKVGAIFAGEDGSRRELTFAELSRDVTRLAEYMGVYRAEANETIIHEGDAGERCPVAGAEERGDRAAGTQLDLYALAAVDCWGRAPDGLRTTEWSVREGAGVTRDWAAPRMSNWPAAQRFTPRAAPPATPTSAALSCTSTRPCARTARRATIRMSGR